MALCDLGSAVGRPVIDENHLESSHRLLARGSQGLIDKGRSVARDHEDRNEWVGHWAPFKRGSNRVLGPVKLPRGYLNRPKARTTLPSVPDPNLAA